MATDSGRTDDLWDTGEPVAAPGLEEPYRALTEAAVELSGEHHVGDITTALLAERSGIPAARVEELFATPAACLRLAAAEAGERLTAPVRATVVGEEWLASVHLGIAGFYGAVAADPARARLALLDSDRLRFPFADHPRLLATRDLETLIAAIPDHGASVPPRVRSFVDEFHASGVIALAIHRLQRGESAGLPGDTRDVSAMIGCFYLARPEVERILSGL